MEQASEIKSVQTPHAPASDVQAAAGKTDGAFLAILDKISYSLNRLLAIVAGASLVLMALLITVNVCIRKFAGPIYGVNEMVGWLSAITAGFAIGYTQIYRGHVDMDILLEKLPPRLSAVIQGLMLFLCTVFFAFVSYQLMLYANDTMKEGTLSETLAVIYYPYIYLLALGFFGLTLALLADSMKFILKGERR